MGLGLGCRSAAAEGYRAATVRAERLVVHLVRVKAGVRLGLGLGLGLAGPVAPGLGLVGPVAWAAAMSGES